LTPQAALLLILGQLFLRNEMKEIYLRTSAGMNSDDEVFVPKSNIAMFSTDKVTDETGSYLCLILYLKSPQQSAFPIAWASANASEARGFLHQVAADIIKSLESSEEAFVDLNPIVKRNIPVIDTPPEKKIIV
jgi:hypothetical protein